MAARHTLRITGSSGSTALFPSRVVEREQDLGGVWVVSIYDGESHRRLDSEVTQTVAESVEAYERLACRALEQVLAEQAPATTPSK